MKGVQGAKGRRWQMTAHAGGLPKAGGKGGWEVQHERWLQLGDLGQCSPHVQHGALMATPQGA